MLGLGPASVLKLKEARARARVGPAAYLLDGIDPVHHKRAGRAAAKAAAAEASTFGESRRAILCSARSRIGSNAAQRDEMPSLAQHADPVIGAVDVAHIDTPLIMKVLAPIWTTKTTTASRVRNRHRADFGLCRGAGRSPGR